MRTADAISHFGSVRDLAQALRITTQAVYLWGKRVPPARAYQLQVLTAGKLRAESEQRAS